MGLTLRTRRLLRLKQLVDSAPLPEAIEHLYALVATRGISCRQTKFANVKLMEFREKAAGDVGLQARLNELDARIQQAVEAEQIRREAKIQESYKMQKRADRAARAKTPLQTATTTPATSPVDFVKRLQQSVENQEEKK